MTEDEMSLDEISEMVRRINEAKMTNELDAIGTELTPRRRGQACQAIAASGPQPELRNLGQTPPTDAPGEVGTPSGNRWYIYSKFCQERNQH